MTERAVIELKL